MMDTQALEQRLKELDARMQALGQALQHARSTRDQYYSQASNLNAMAENLLCQARDTEGEDGQSSRLISQASAYMSQAEQYRAMADQMQGQCETMENELRGYRPEYEGYKGEGERNIADLNTAANKLTGLSGSKYGSANVSQILSQIRQRLLYNENLVRGCQQRMAWIDQICGSSGSQMVKTYGRSR